MLTVKDLCEILSAMDPDDPIVMSSDPEGNRYSYVSRQGVSEIVFRPDGGWGGDVVDPDEQADGDIRAVCFWPE